MPRHPIPQIPIVHPLPQGRAPAIERAPAISVMPVALAAFIFIATASFSSVALAQSPNIQPYKRSNVGNLPPVMDHNFAKDLLNELSRVAPSKPQWIDYTSSVMSFSFAKYCRMDNEKRTEMQLFAIATISPPSAYIKPLKYLVRGCNVRLFARKIGDVRSYAAVYNGPNSELEPSRVVNYSNDQSILSIFVLSKHIRRKSFPEFAKSYINKAPVN